MSASKAKWVRLGDYIEPCDERNSKDIYTINDVRGISTEKKFIPTKANMDGVSLTSYKVIKSNEFVYVADTSRRGDKIALALNMSETPIIVSSIYTAFRCKDSNELSPEYLYLLFSRSEFDRYARFNSWGSARETFDWEEFGRTQVPLPPIEVQQELVDTYNGLKALAEQNEALVAQLSKMCEALVVEAGKKHERDSVGEFIELDEETNIHDEDFPFMGININKEFMSSVANTEGLNRVKYKVMRKGKFVFSGMQTGRDVCIRIGLYGKEEPALVSPAYTTFRIKDGSKVLPEFFFLQFKRFESDRLGWFYSDGSIRSNLDWERFKEIKIPLPPIDVQQSIVNLYHCMEEAKSIAASAREQLKTICPALVLKGASA